jgi:hypothetical protein
MTTSIGQSVRDAWSQLKVKWSRDGPPSDGPEDLASVATKARSAAHVHTPSSRCAATCGCADCRTPSRAGVAHSGTTRDPRVAPASATAPPPGAPPVPAPGRRFPRTPRVRRGPLTRRTNPPALESTL